MSRSLTDRRAGLFGGVLLAGGLWAMSLAGCAACDAVAGKTGAKASPDAGLAPLAPLARAVPISSISSLSGTQVKAGQPVSFVAMIDKTKTFAAGDSFAVEVRATDSGTWNAPLEVLHARPIEVAVDNPRAELVYFYLHTAAGKAGKFVVRTRSSLGASNEVTITVTQ
ncbi:MAG: hypothetical protein LW650_11910 [Planctomycetaceae bacterium]|jgi:hypothetical protein|nr:hypothetical protein [Phycisphaerales bacterium]MCE2654133.1 hypothetical protein [Planctomycetaceae bacterium]